MSLNPLYVLHGEVSVQVLCPFFNWIVFLEWSCVSSLSVLEIKPLSEANTGKYIFLYGWFLFHFADVFFSHAEAFYLMKSHLCILSFMSLALGDILVKILLHKISEIFLPMFSSRTLIVSLYIYIKIFIVIQLQLCAISPQHSTPPRLNPPPSPISTLSLILSMCPL